MEPASRIGEAGKRNMKKQHNISEHQLTSRYRNKRNRKAAIGLDEIHKKHGYFDSKIFYAKDKATYTFLKGDAVIVLHLDISRHCLYLNGHKVTSIDAHPDLSDFLTVFKQCLEENSMTQNFIQPFDTIVSHLCETN